MPRTTANKTTTRKTPPTTASPTTASPSIDASTSPATHALRPRRASRVRIDHTPIATKRADGVEAALLTGPTRRKPKPATTKKAAKSAGPANGARVATSGPRPLSAFDAAARVLAGLGKSESKAGLTAADLIERMSVAKLWTSPGGKTPAATLYAAMTREIATKGSASRFVRLGPGRFASSTSTGTPARQSGGAK